MEILNQLHQSTIASIVFANHCILGLTKVGSDPGTESRGPSRRRVIGFPPIRLRPWRPPPCFPCMSFYSQVFTFGVVEFCDLSSCFVCTPTSANFSSSRIEDFFIFFLLSWLRVPVHTMCLCQMRGQIYDWRVRGICHVRPSVQCRGYIGRTSPP